MVISGAVIELAGFNCAIFLLKGDRDASCLDFFDDRRSFFFERERLLDEFDPDEEKRLEDDELVLELLELPPRFPRFRCRRDLRISPSSVSSFLAPPFSTSKKSMLKLGRWRPLDRSCSELRASWWLGAIFRHFW